MNPTPQLLLLMFAGPNGAGKSTLRELLFSDPPIPFINADLIGAEIFGPNAATKAYEAASLAEEQRQLLFQERRSFMFETVLSDPVGAKVAFLQKAREAGYHVIVHFVGLDSAERSRSRVIQRVHEGGHDVPDDKIFDRYPRVLVNLRRLLKVAHELTIYDNSLSSAPYRVLATLEDGHLTSFAASPPVWIATLGLQDRLTPDTRRLA